MIKLSTTVFLALWFSASSWAQDINIVGTLTQQVHPSTAKVAKPWSKLSVTVPKTKQLVLLNIELSEKEKQHLSAKAKRLLSPRHSWGADIAKQSSSKWPERIQLGMNNVPVLDQGPHGSCVTFAVTAAMDAVLNKGDYISQLCQLQLGNYFEKQGYQPSGWEGSFARKVLAQMEAFGFVSKAQQEANGCGGLTQYPINDIETPTSSITPEEYRQMSYPLEDYNEDRDIFWNPIVDVIQVVFDRVDPEDILDKVKRTLNEGDRLVFGSLLWDIDLGVAGAVGIKEVSSDTWVLTPEIARDVYIRKLVFAGHEMVITGYDDTAVAIDDKGRKHYGLLTIRNSWGTSLGNQGEFYMSYDYFKMFVIEVARIRMLTLDDYS